MTPFDFEKQNKTLGPYVRGVADLVGLRDWYFDLMRDNPADENAIASCNATYGRKYAMVWFAEDFRNQTMQLQKATVLHELLHCHAAPLQYMMTQSDFKAELAASAWNIWHGMFCQNLEYLIDALAYEFSKYLPDIKWPDEEEPTATFTARHLARKVIELKPQYYGFIIV